MKTWRVAILGAGRMGLAHAEAWRALGARAHVQTVASRTTSGWATRLGIETSLDLRVAIDDPSIDVVDICLPTPLHRAAAEHALAAGKHVLLEKPIALELADAAAIVEASERADRQLMVAHVVRFFAGYRSLRSVVESGELGAPLGARAARLSAGSSDIAWIRDTARSGGVTVDLLVHDFDQLNMLFGEPRTAFARLTGERSVHAIVGYDGGAVAAVEGSTAMPAPYRFSTVLRVRCADGVLEYASGELGDGAAIRIWPDAGAARRLDVRPNDPYADQAGYFLDRLDRGEPVTEGTAQQAYAALAVARAALRSAREDLPIDIGRAARRPDRHADDDPGERSPR